MGALKAGIAVVDITPPSGLPLAGFAARTEPATGAHDPLTVRAVVVGDTAIVVADVIGIHEAMSARIRERCPLPSANVIVAATHTHGAPVSITLGRHSNDRMVSFYVRTPSGFDVEFGWDGWQVDWSNYVPTRSEIFSLWGHPEMKGG